MISVALFRQLLRQTWDHKNAYTYIYIPLIDYLLRQTKKSNLLPFRALKEHRYEEKRITAWITNVKSSASKIMQQCFWSALSDNWTAFTCEGAIWEIPWFARWDVKGLFWLCSLLNIISKSLLSRMLLCFLSRKRQSSFLICLLRWVISDLHFYVVFFIFILKQVFLSPSSQLYLNSFQFWGANEEPL